MSSSPYVHLQAPSWPEKLHTFRFHARLSAHIIQQLPLVRARINGTTWQFHAALQGIEAYKNVSLTLRSLTEQPWIPLWGDFCTAGVRFVDSGDAETCVFIRRLFSARRVALQKLLRECRCCRRQASGAPALTRYSSAPLANWSTLRQL